MKDNNLEQQKNESVNNIKLGRFQLQTKSFWLSFVSLMIIFLLAMVCTNMYFYNKMIKLFLNHEDAMMQTVIINKNAK